MDNEHKPYKVKDVAEFLGVNESDVRSCIDSGTLKCLNCGTEVLVTEAMLKNFEAMLKNFLSATPTNTQNGIDNTGDNAVTLQHSKKEKDVSAVKEIRGYVSELKTGKNRYMATIEFGKKANGKRDTKSHRCPTQKEAEDWVAKQIIEYSDKMKVEAISQEKQSIEVKITGNVYVSVYIPYFLGLGTTDAKARTLESYYSMANHIVKPVAEYGLGDYRLKDLNVALVEKFLNEFRRKYAQGTVDKLYTVLRLALKYAYKHKYISEDIIAEVKKPKSLIRSQKVEAYSLETENLILEKAKNYPEMHPILLMLSRTGIRPQELRALKWKNLDENKKTIAVTNAIISDSSGHRIGQGPKEKRELLGETKSEAGVRVIPLTDDVIEALQKWREYIDNNDEFVYARNEEFIFTTRKGGFIGKSALRSKFQRFINSSGLKNIDETITLYKFRHTFCTRLMDKNINLAVVKKLMGDSTTSVIVDHYTTVSEETTRNALDTIF